MDFRGGGRRLGYRGEERMGYYSSWLVPSLRWENEDSEAQRLALNP